jgi:hypothetical protein
LRYGYRALRVAFRAQRQLHRQERPRLIVGRVHIIIFRLAGRSPI